MQQPVAKRARRVAPAAQQKGRCFATEEKNLLPALRRYLGSRFVDEFKHDGDSYVALVEGAPMRVYGVKTGIRHQLHPNFANKPTKRRRGAKTKAIGSSKEQGQRVDREIGYTIAGYVVLPMHPMTARLLHYWTVELGHTLQAAQVGSSLLLRFHSRDDDRCRSARTPVSGCESRNRLPAAMRV